MTIDEAIKLQTELKSLLPEVGFNKYLASTQLGIEALKFIDAERKSGYIDVSDLLPGETTE